ncbi:MAG: aldehyde ferredoxin oxidoreductase family protein [Limnochordia bacterium]|jgi:aldehyde:ferredoxin oxidoreductase|nr:aldehyde ferredoxin oxidoreductase family protein [Bacillota bacterium]
MFGWMGTILRVNLSTGTITREKLDGKIARDYIGARGLASKILYDELPSGTDPLDPANLLIFAAGPLTGTAATSASRYNVVTKSPLTGAIAASNSGGYLPAEIRYAGYDMIIIEGKSEEPVYLWVHNDQVKIRSARAMWGKGTGETEALIREETDDEAKIISIGLAGEKLVRFAGVVNDRERAAGRSGVGAVMGSKNLKAIAVRGTGGIRIKDVAAFRDAVLDNLAKIKSGAVTGEGLPTYGTAVLVNVINSHGILPTNNFQRGEFHGAEAISGETLARELLIRNRACLACPIGCGRVTEINWEGDEERGEGPEYETIWALGAACGISDLELITKINYLCNEYGLDPITLGSTLACAMELFADGALTVEETGMPLNFGDGQCLLEMTRKTALREGFGDVLAEGSARLAEKYGRPELSMTSKKQEYPAYDPRGSQGIGLGYATSNRGGCHVRGYTIAAEIVGAAVDPLTSEGKAQLLIDFQDFTCVVDSVGMCLFTTFSLGLDDILPLLKAATGVDYTSESLLQAGERIWNLERLFNLREGLGRQDDSLAPRLLQEPLSAGPAKGNVVELESMLDEYYELRGWDGEGRPSSEKLQALGLG